MSFRRPQEGRIRSCFSLARCVADPQSYYLLTFDYPPAPAFGQRHTLAVQLHRPALVRTRTLYYAEQ